MCDEEVNKLRKNKERREKHQQYPHFIELR